MPNSPDTGSQSIAPSNGWFYFSSEALTAAVKIENDRIVRAASPIARKFVGQPAANLERWMRRQGGFRKESSAPWA